MRLCFKILVALGVLAHAILPQSAGATINASSLERLNWLCSDYQMAVKGFVVECWFVLPEGIISDACLEEMLDVDLKKEINVLSDNSMCRVSSKHEQREQYIELQLITTNINTAIDYEKMWKEFGSPTGPRVWASTGGLEKRMGFSTGGKWVYLPSTVIHTHSTNGCG